MTTWDDLLTLLIKLQGFATLDDALKDRQQALAATTAAHADIQQQVEDANTKLIDLKAQKAAEIIATQATLDGLRKDIANVSGQLAVAQAQLVSGP